MSQNFTCPHLVVQWVWSGRGDGQWAGLEDSGGASEVGMSVKHQFPFFVPGHAGDRGNEQADKLADKVNVEDGQVKNHTDKVNASWEVRDLHESGDYCESAAITRLQEQCQKEWSQTRVILLEAQEEK